ncbi:MAG: hypothetical protein OEW04_05520, partial [Nitrospirota bacterium]|nr:hypothetical protein [Nitrospirota bacterium]
MTKKKITDIILLPLKFRLGEHTILIILSFIIGILAGLTNVIFRFSMNLVHEIIFLGGSDLLRINEGGIYRVLLPLLPVLGAVLLIPLSMLFPGDVNGYGFSR